MVRRSAQIGQYQISVTCERTLERQAESLLGLFDRLHRQGISIKDGIRIQFGWSMLVFREQSDGILAVLEPDFDKDPFRDERADISCTLKIQAHQISFAERVGVEPEVVSFQDKIVLSRGCLQEHEIYLERSAHDRVGDSGWYIGSRDSASAQPELEAIRVFQLLRQRQELLPALILPTGYMVVVSGNKIEVVVDPSNNEVQRL